MEELSKLEDTMRDERWIRADRGAAAYWDHQEKAQGLVSGVEALHPLSLHVGVCHLLQ